jgi:hypothetical protein
MPPASRERRIPAAPPPIAQARLRPDRAAQQAPARAGARRTQPTTPAATPASRRSVQPRPRRPSPAHARPEVLRSRMRTGLRRRRPRWRTGQSLARLRRARSLRRYRRSCYPAEPGSCRSPADRNRRSAAPARAYRATVPPSSDAAEGYAEQTRLSAAARGLIELQRHVHCHAPVSGAWSPPRLTGGVLSVPRATTTTNAIPFGLPMSCSGRENVRVLPDSTTGSMDGVFVASQGSDAQG